MPTRSRAHGYTKPRRSRCRRPRPCRRPWNGIAWTFTITSPSWHLNDTSGNNTSAVTDVLTGTLTNISGVRVTWNTGCAYNVGGSVAGYFDEDNGKGGQELGVTSSSLTVSNANFLCFGIVSNGDPATFTGTYNSSSQSINIS